MTLWYFETVSQIGRWSPCTAPEKPDTATYMGAQRIRTASGALGPRVRRIVEVPAGMADLPLNELRQHLWGDHSDAAVTRINGEAA